MNAMLFLNKIKIDRWLTKLVVIAFLCVSNKVSAQEINNEKVRDTSFFSVVDSLYREDQFYIGITYNSIFDSPSGFKPNKIPLGFHAGMLRDMPINKARTKAIAVGLGVSYNSYQHNLYMSEVDGNYAYQILDAGDISKNKMELLYMEVPLELRWRTSTPESHKFFRLHAGFKLRYLVYEKSTYRGSFGKDIVVNNSDFNKLQFGPTLSIGYNTWNFYGYYGLNSLLKNAQVSDEKISFKTLHLGLIFYIL